MSDFIRARSAEQKEQRVAEIKRAADELFAQNPYHEITLTTIAEKLGWSRASLYKYANTKEEIFLLLAQDEMNGYFGSLLAALPAGCCLSPAAIAEVWAGIANAHQKYFRLGDLLFNIVETNVALEKLVEFKGAYYAHVKTFSQRLSELLGISEKRGAHVVETVYYHAVGYATTCAGNPMVATALEVLGVEKVPVDFRAEMHDFIGMCLSHEIAAV